jgi:transcriptional regulator with XRE-family HTH domain
MKSRPAAKQTAATRNRKKVPDRRPSGRRVPKPWTLGWLTNVYLSQGREAAESALRAIVPAPDLHTVVKSGQPTLRTDVEDRDGISYEHFNPQAFWEVPYSILKVRFQPRVKDDFMFHRGEEFLVPLDGDVMYHFFWSGGRAPAVRVVLDAPVQVGSIICIDAQTPHHTWAARGRPADAWMILRDVSDRAVSISVDPDFNPKRSRSDVSRRVSAKQLEDPARYALVAWGLVERLRSHRERARLTIAELAARCDVDAGHLSRVEAGKANLSLETLLRIARFLQVNVADLVPARADRPWRIGTFAGARGALTPLFPERAGQRHLMHTHVLELDETSGIDVAAGRDLSEYSSWIALAGRTLFEFSERGASTGELVERGNVVHFRSALALRIRALEPSQLLRITYSAVCSCGGPQKSA